MSSKLDNYYFNCESQEAEGSERSSVLVGHQLKDSMGVVKAAGGFVLISTHKTPEIDEEGGKEWWNIYTTSTHEVAGAEDCGLAHMNTAAWKELFGEEVSEEWGSVYNNGEVYFIYDDGGFVHRLSWAFE
jgi:hypothetical protein